MMPNLGFIFPLLQAAPNPAGTPLPSKNILSNRASGHMHYYIFTECGQPKEENRQFFVSVSDSAQEVESEKFRHVILSSITELTIPALSSITSL